MKKEFIEYLNQIGLTNPFQQRVEEIFEFYENLLSFDTIENIFISEYVDEEKKRQYESLWLFSSTKCYEAKRFLEKDKDDFDCTLFVDKITRWQIEKKNYDFKNDALSESRFTLNFSLLHSIKGILKASYNNCPFLKNIFLKYILPNVI